MVEDFWIVSATNPPKTLSWSGFMQRRYSDHGSKHFRCINMYNYLVSFWIRVWFKHVFSELLICYNLALCSTVGELDGDRAGKLLQEVVVIIVVHRSPYTSYLNMHMTGRGPEQWVFPIFQKMRFNSDKQFNRINRSKENAATQNSSFTKDVTSETSLTRIDGRSHYAELSC